MDGGLGLTAIIGGILLAAVLLFAMLRNKQRTGSEFFFNDSATHDLYKRMDADDKRDETAP